MKAVNNNIEKDFTYMEYIISLYERAGMKLQDLMQYTMNQCNAFYYAHDINSYIENQFQKANKSNTK